MCIVFGVESGLCSSGQHVNRHDTFVFPSNGRDGHSPQDAGIVHDTVVFPEGTKYRYIPTAQQQLVRMM